MNPGGIQVSPYGTLLGRPVIVSQHANTFSSAGDVLLADLSYYQTITKAGGMQTATSMHLYFDADLTAFRTTFRMDGQSKIAAPIIARQGQHDHVALCPTGRSLIRRLTIKEKSHVSQCKRQRAVLGSGHHRPGQPGRRHHLYRLDLGR
jgi:hypothetical protein